MSVTPTSGLGGFYQQLTMRNKGIGGLATGMDTNALVEAMTMATRTRLAKQAQQKTALSWKMTAYRGVASSLRTFHNNNISMSASGNSIKSSAFFNVFKGTSSSDKITVRPGSGASPGSFTVDQIKEIATSQTFTTRKFSHSLEGGEFELGGDYTGKTLQLSLDGSARTIRLDTLNGLDNPNDFNNELQRLIDNAFGRRTPSAGEVLSDYDTSVGDGRVSIIKAELALGSEAGKYTLSLSANANTVTVVNNAAGNGLELASGMTNRISLNSSIGDLLGDDLTGDTFQFSINDVVFNINKDDSIGSFINRVNSSAAGVRVSYSAINESFVFTSNVTGEGDNIRFNDISGNFLGQLTGNGGDPQNLPNAVRGTNAEIVIDGRVISSSTNTFTVNGVAFEVNGVTEANANIVINVTTDPDDVVSKIKNFINEYNTLIDSLDAMLKEKKVAGYQPLTDEQRAEMSESEIRNWETEAKKGLLNNDSTIRGIMSQMRTSLYQKVDAAGISLFDIGITTESNSVSNNGRLELTETGEAKLRKMLDQNPDAVRNLFTYHNGAHESDEGFDITRQGLAHRLEFIIDNAVRISGTRPGSLVALAGSDVITGNNESSLGRRIDLIDKQIALLKTRLENEYNRYWKKFAALETAVARMNTQMGWLENFGQQQ